jgi:mono/diheme cytochrome c family protein
MRYLLSLMALMSVAGAALAAPDPNGQVAPATRGLFVALRKCAACHAVGPLGAGPDAEAPPFGAIRLRHDSVTLRQRLGEISVSGHQNMPPIRLSAKEIEDVASYIETVAPAAPAGVPASSQIAFQSPRR